MATDQQHPNTLNPSDVLRKRRRRPPELPRGPAALRAGVGTRTRPSNRGPATSRRDHPQRPAPGIDQADGEEEAQAECSLLVRHAVRVLAVSRDASARRVINVFHMDMPHLVEV